MWAAQNFDSFEIPARFLEHFEKEAMLGFLAQAEQSIANGIDPSVFGEMFYSQFPEQASKLVTAFGHEEVLDVVRTFPGSESSVLVMRDGEKWMESLWNDVRKRVPAASEQAQTA